MWKKFNNNPAGRNVGDCAVRAISVALSGAVLRKHGFVRESLPDSCPDCYSAEDFCMERPKGIFVLYFGGHVATVVDGCIYDSWDSSHRMSHKRDSMGRYSRAENGVSRAGYSRGNNVTDGLREIMYAAPQEMQGEIQRLIKKLDNM